MEELRANAVLPVIEDGHGRPVHYPCCEEHGDTQPRGSSDSDRESGQQRKRGSRGACCSTLCRGIEVLKYACSLALLGFSIAVVMGAMFTNQTVATGNMFVPGKYEKTRRQ